MSGYFHGTWHLHWHMSRYDVIVYHGQSLTLRSGRICLDFFSTIFSLQKMISWIRGRIKKCVFGQSHQDALSNLRPNNSDFISDVYHNRQSFNGFCFAYLKVSLVCAKPMLDLYQNDRQLSSVRHH